MNSVAPGYIETDMTAALGDEIRSSQKTIPLQRLGRAEDVAADGFPCGDGAAYITGQVIHVDGGMYM